MTLFENKTIDLLVKVIVCFAFAAIGLIYATGTPMYFKVLNMEDEQKKHGEAIRQVNIDIQKYRELTISFENMEEQFKSQGEEQENLKSAVISIKEEQITREDLNEFKQDIKDFIEISNRRR